MDRTPPFPERSAKTPKAALVACGLDAVSREGRQGSPQRFCTPDHRHAFWNAARLWSMRAVETGLLSIDSLKATQTSVYAARGAFRAAGEGQRRDEARRFDGSISAADLEWWELPQGSAAEVIRNYQAAAGVTEKGHPTAAHHGHAVDHRACCHASLKAGVNAIINLVLLANSFHGFGWMPRPMSSNHCRRTDLLAQRVVLFGSLWIGSLPCPDQL
jgi:hypothetical protein